MNINVLLLLLNVYFLKLQLWTDLTLAPKHYHTWMQQVTTKMVQEKFRSSIWLNFLFDKLNNFTQFQKWSNQRGRAQWSASVFEG